MSIAKPIRQYIEANKPSLRLLASLQANNLKYGLFSVTWFNKLDGEWEDCSDFEFRCENFQYVTMPEFEKFLECFQKANYDLDFYYFLGKKNIEFYYC